MCHIFPKGGYVHINFHYLKKKLQIFRLDKNAVYSINDVIHEDDKICYYNFFGKLRNPKLPCKVAVNSYNLI